MIYGLIGEKLGHSYSREIHRELGQEGYQLYELKPEQVKAFVTSPEIGGLNVTIPYKKTVIPFCDSLSDSARAIGSVNTLRRDEKGRLHGYNTDYDGFLYMLSRAGIRVEGKKVLILGDGGTSLTARAAVKHAGAREVVVASRKPESGPSLLSEPGEREGKDSGCPVKMCAYSLLSERHGDSQIIVNTTPVGMYPNAPDRLISLSDFPQCRGVADVIYNPGRTDLIQQAVEKGLPATDGLPMLVTQAKVAEEIFTGKHIPESELERIIGKLRASRENIVLVGMPGSGKTSVGKAVARRLGREFVDVDRLIEEQEGKSIPEIFKDGGEEGFRRLESAAIAEQGKRTGLVIATGGGAILAEKNYLPLKQNGRIFWIQRDWRILPTDGRPLSDPNAMEQMYQRRMPRYRRFADEVIKNDKTVEAAARRIVELVSKSV